MFRANAAFTEEGGDVTRIVPSFAAGSDASVRVGLKVSGPLDVTTKESAPRLNYLLSTSHFETDGPRQHSAARRDLGNAKLVFTPDAKTTITLIANAADLPRAQDPLGLTRAQFERDRRSVDASALQFNTRKSFAQTQAGAIVEHEVDANNRVRVLLYGGARNTQQFQAIPIAAQTPVTSAGGVIDLERNYVGADLRYTHRTHLAEQPFSIVAGLAIDRLDEHRRGFENFSGPIANRVLGVQGAVRRDEDNDVRDADQYLQASWSFAPRWTLDAGVRHSVVRFASNDRYVVVTPSGINPDDSGRVRYQATLPVAGLLFRATPALHLYATAGRGFETPTFNELSYRPDGASGLNFALRPAKSDSVEAGVKSRVLTSEESSLRVNAAIFSTRTNDEIVTLSNIGGRATFTNAGRTQRRGAELSLEWLFANAWRVHAAFTLLDARYRDPFATCNATPCAKPTLLVPSGNRIPGVAGNASYVEIAYAPESGWRAGLEARRAGKVFVDDSNSDAASHYAVLNARVGYLRRFARSSIEGYTRIDNITDRRYAGSVIVNEGNRRYFEPAQGRTFFVGATATISFE